MRKQKLNNGWLFYKDGCRQSARLLDLPHDAMLAETRQPELPKGSGSGFFPGGKYWYEKTIFGEESYAERTVILEFEGVYMNSTVLLNGEEVGGWVYGYTNFYVDLTGKLLVGQDNVITVIADNSQQPNSRWYSGSGIYRDVNLYVGHREHIVPDGIRVKTLSHAPAVLEVAVEAVKAGDTEVVIEIMDGETVIACSGGEKAALTVPDAKLWNAECPNLYTVRVTLQKNGAILDESHIRTGIRSLAWDSSAGLQVNGKTVKLRGGCIHHDHGPLGACSYDKAEYRRVKKLKALGYNAIRYAHNPSSRILLEVCDELGMYVLDETFDQWKLPQSDKDYAIYFDKEWMKDVKALIRKDFSHPSVIMYCIGNEITDTGLPHGALIAKMINDVFKAEDPTRPTTIAINPMLTVLARKMAEAKAQGAENQGSMGSAEVNDIVTLLPKILAGITPESLEALLKDLLQHVDIAGYNYSAHLLEGTHALVPDRVILHSETFPCRIADGWKIVERNDSIIGDFMWTAWDYLGEAGVGEPTYGTTQAPFSKEYPCQNAAIGAVDLTGEPEPFAYYVATLWGAYDKPYLAVRPLDHAGEEYTLGKWRATDAVHSWSWPGQEGKTTDVEVYTKAQEVELICNGISLGRKATENCKAVFQAVYTPGKLEAVAYDASGSEQGRGALITAQAETKLTICAEETKIRANGEDLAYVSVEITDNAGIRKMLSDRKITVSVSGAGRLAAVGSAACRTEESYLGDSFTTYNGRMIAIVRSTGLQGTITVTAAAEGLTPVSIALEAR
ncbi:MAG: DUF4982 domain-containing protein [Oscillospiraceae bacterium]|nr:DUF4982 domain-containing protein [Oscillospiraceae bacterium]